MKGLEMGSGEGSSMLKLFVTCRAAGPLPFIGVFLIAGAARANHGALRHPASSLSMGDGVDTGGEPHRHGLAPRSG